MRIKKIELERLFEMFNKYELTELTVKKGKLEITLKRERKIESNSDQSIVGFANQSITTSTPLDLNRSIKEQLFHDSDCLNKKEEGNGLNVLIHEIKAPLVGFFYRASSPEAEPFVKEGDEVKVNDKLCIVEAMKVMNEIVSPVNGVVRQICVENGKAVEFGQVLFRIEVKEN